MRPDVAAAVAVAILSTAVQDRRDRRCCREGFGTGRLVATREGTGLLLAAVGFVRSRKDMAYFQNQST